MVSPAVASESIRSASEFDYPPFAVVTASGQADGFSVELLRAAAHAVGRKVEFKIGAWHVLKRELATGRLQILPLVARTAARDRIYDFSVPYLTMHGTIIVRKGERRIREIADLHDKKILVVKGDIAEEYIAEHRIANQVYTEESPESALRQLARGRYDAIVMQKLAGQNLIRSLGLDNLESVGAPLDHYQEFCFAVQEGDKELLSLLNEGLALVVSDGTFERLRKKWLGPLVENTMPPLIPIVGAALGALLIAWGVAYLWQRALLRTVRTRTAELIAANDQLAQEIRERQRAEQALQRSSKELEAMFSNIHMHVAILDSEFRLLRVNAAYAAAAGKCADELLGQSHFALFPSIENERVFKHVVATGNRFCASVRPCDHHPDRTFYWDFVVTPLMDPQGSVEGLVLALIDVTKQEEQRQAVHEANRRARLELEQRVRERTAQLEAANQELESFSYSVSHDLRGPLRAINGFTEILHEDYCSLLDTPALAYLGRIKNATLRMNELIDGLLLLSQVFRSGLHVARVDLSALALDIAGLLQAAEPGRQVRFHIEPDLTVAGDPGLLRVMLQNLFGNAWKFTRHQDEPVITLSRSFESDGQEYFFVKDNGVGFDMAYVHKLFRPFERLHAQDEFEGTGIGLATVRRVILRHGGRVWAVGAPGKGATIYFTLGS